MRTQMHAKFWYRNTKKRDNFKRRCHKWEIIKGTDGGAGVWNAPIAEILRRQ